MPNLGMGELIVILLILVLVFGASRLPALGESIGKSIRGLKRGLASDDDIEVSNPAPRRVAAKSSAEDAPEVADGEVVERKPRQT